jgi:hypothetical protein
MKPGDSLPLRDVLDPKPGPLISTVAPPEPPLPRVVRDDFGFFGEANVIATAISAATGRNRHRFPLWIRITAIAMAVCAFVPVVLKLLVPK